MNRPAVAPPGRWPTHIAQLLGLVAAAALVLALPALARQEGVTDRQTASLAFTTKKSAKSTGTRLDIDYMNPDDPEGKPPAVRRFVLRLPRGGRFDTAVPEACTASDEQLTAVGAGACPPGSQVGTAEVTVDSGFPGQLRFAHVDVVFFNAPNELINLATVRGTEVRTVIRAEVTRREVITPFEPLPGAPPDGGSVDTVHTFDPALSRVIDGVKRHYITTPRRCPHWGYWTTRLIFTYADEVTQKVKSPAPCS